MEAFMAENSLVQTRIDKKVKERASQVLAEVGMTVSDAVRILLTRTAREGVLPIELIADSEAYDAWFRRKVQAALDDLRPATSDEDVEAHFARRRAAARRAGSGDPR
ncbi:type II toxin-antitoxin system RelB/DinJ family antitoxin [Sphingosinicella terrae]|uniref:type II toxin-antitoxin system RelB/DinJ family antitoxin n=1 Tax=Sphingosinicella terrae TaxID=2172047 RepID=UPI0025496B1A|nr:type II toxin-antitoxin system RelB/DinJ family antitoxin [Sphingosinicella terrae]